MKVILINNQDKAKLNLNIIKKVITYISNKFNRSQNYELNVVFVEKEEIGRLNKKYRNVDRETDVLSFSYVENNSELTFKRDANEFGYKSGHFTVGEIIICPEVAEDNAYKEKENWNSELEIILLATHGILHIYGYDHEGREDRIEMNGIQENILNDARSVFKI